MACFLVPTAEAIVTTVVTKIAEKKEIKEDEKVNFEVVTEGAAQQASVKPTAAKSSFIRNLKWLSYMLWGGAILLAFEHVWHGEVTPWFPFLTAASNPADTASMLHEMATAGVSMAILVTAVWLGIVAATSMIEKRADKVQPASTNEGGRS